MSKELQHEQKTVGITELEKFVSDTKKSRAQGKRMPSASVISDYLGGLIGDGYSYLTVKAINRMARGVSEGVHWLQAYGCWVKVEGKKLLCLRAEANGEPEMFNGQEYWGEVIAPENQNFLDAVNSVLGTEFRYRQFM